MRRFWLKKGSKIWDLTTKNTSTTGGSFFGSPEGLGVKVKIESFEVERAFFIENVKLESIDITGKLYFLNYEHYTNFVNFLGYIETAEPLRLYYSTDETVNYNDPEQWYKAVMLKELSKSEIEFKTGCLVCNVKFAALSRWRKDKVISLELSPFGSPLVYPYIYPYVYGGSNNMAVVIDNTGNLPTSCIIRVDAETDTPVFRVIKDNQLIEQAKYNVYIRPGSHLIVDSSADKQEASLYTESGGNLAREDVYYLGERDYAFSNFITIPEGVSMLLFSAANAEFGKITIQYSHQRELV